MYQSTTYLIGSALSTIQLFMFKVALEELLGIVLRIGLPCKSEVIFCREHGSRPSCLRQGKRHPVRSDPAVPNPPYTVPSPVHCLPAHRQQRQSSPRWSRYHRPVRPHPKALPLSRFRANIRLACVVSALEAVPSQRSTSSSSSPVSPTGTV